MWPSTTSWKARAFEAELAGEVTPGWNVFLGYTYRQSKDNEGRKVQTTQPEQLLKASTAYRPAAGTS